MYIGGPSRSPLAEFRVGYKGEPFRDTGASSNEATGGGGERKREGGGGASEPADGFIRGEEERSRVVGCGKGPVTRTVVRRDP